MKSQCASLNLTPCYMHYDAIHVSLDMLLKNSLIGTTRYIELTMENAFNKIRAKKECDIPREKNDLVSSQNEKNLKGEFF